MSVKHENTVLIVTLGKTEVVSQSEYVGRWEGMRGQCWPVAQGYRGTGICPDVWQCPRVNWTHLRATSWVWGSASATPLWCAMCYIQLMTNIYFFRCFGEDVCISIPDIDAYVMVFQANEPKITITGMDHFARPAAQFESERGVILLPDIRIVSTVTKMEHPVDFREYDRGLCLSFEYFYSFCIVSSCF